MHEDVLSRTTVIDLLQQLIRIPSVNPSIAPDEAHDERAIAALVRDWLSAQGIRCWLEEAAPARPNVIAEVGDGHGPTIAFCAHLDTVGTAGMAIPPFSPRIEGRRVYGRGSYDMKGGLAAIMAAAASIVRTGLCGRLLLALVADEEYASIGADGFVQRHSADACILAEPSDEQIILAHKGFVWAELITTGRAAHGSRWDLGVSAIAKMGRIVAALEQFDQQELRQRVHPLVGAASLHCSLIRGGVGISTYAPECRLQVERRTIPGETAAQVKQELQDVVRRAGEDAEVRCFFDRPPLISDAQSPIARALGEAARVVTGSDPVEAGVPYWTDAAIFSAAGIPSVNYGPSGAGAHEAVEWVDLESVITCARVLAETAHRFCQSPSASR